MCVGPTQPTRAAQPLAHRQSVGFTRATTWGWSVPAPADGLRADLFARSLGRGGLLCPVGAVGLAIDLQDDRRIHDPV